MDAFQWAGVGSSLLQIIILLVFYGDQVYVSDLLARVVPYKVVITVFVFAQAALFCMYLYRTRHEQLTASLLGLTSIVTYITGWIMLSIQWNDSSNAHRAGAGIFMFGIGATVLLMTALCRKHMIPAVAMAVLFLFGLVCGIAFVFRFYAEGEDAWIFEHWSFIAAICIQMIFFSLKSPSPLPAVVYSSMPRIEPSHIQRAV